jgi:mono/diheme cytochrome c family protein
MSAEFQSPATTESEPTSTLAVVPVWLIVLMLVLVYWGAVYFDKHGGWFNRKVYGPYTSMEDAERFYPLPRSGPDLRRGRALFESNCALCHNPDGMGKPNQAPPLAGSEWVTTEGVNRVIRIPLVGLNGPLEVKGQQWNLSMAGMGAAYSDADLAAVLCYIRTSWGNKASPVTAEQVKKVKADLAGRSQPYTAQELKGLPEK